MLLQTFWRSVCTKIFLEFRETLQAFTLFHTICVKALRYSLRKAADLYYLTQDASSSTCLYTQCSTCLYTQCSTCLYIECTVLQILQPPVSLQNIYQSTSITWPVNCCFAALHAFCWSAPMLWLTLPILTTNTRSTSLFLGAFAKLRGGERRGCNNRQYLHPALVGEWETEHHFVRRFPVFARSSFR
jgi:hypothetical protein